MFIDCLFEKIVSIFLIVDFCLFLQVTDAYPQLLPFYSPFELHYDSEVVFQWMRNNNYVIPIVSIIFYLLFCYYGQIYMKDRKPFKLEASLAWWNLFLTLYSVYGMVRMVPHTLWLLSTKSFEETLCDPVQYLYGLGAAGLAVQTFCLSKLPELIDTVFIVLRKKPLIFLHWYHHVTVLFFCWDSYVSESSAGHYFASMNLTVHAIMYFYFYMQAIKSVPKWFPSWIITFVQIAQMVAGTFLVAMGIYYHAYGGAKFAPGQCGKFSNLAVGGIIYASYLYLFIEFAFKRFILGDTELVSKMTKKKTT